VSHPTDYSLEKGLPASLDAERSILGAVLLDDKLWEQTAPLSHDDFSLDGHRRIFARMRSLRDAGKPVDMITLAGELDRRKEVEAVGGVAYLSSLIDGVPERPNIEHYVQIVKDKARLRGLINVCQNAIAEAIEHSDEVETVLARAATGVAQIQADVAKDPFERIAEITIPTYDAMMAQSEGEPKLSTSLGMFDAISTGIREEELWIVAGDPGSGKSAFASQIAGVNAKNGRNVGIFSIEMRSQRVLKRMWAHEAKIPFNKLRRPWQLTTEERERLDRVVMQEVGGWPIFINELSTQTPESFTAQARYAVLKYKLDLLIVDHIQIMTGKAKDEVERVMNTSRALRQFAKDYCPVLALSQFSRPPKTAGQQRPTMRDLKGSSALEQDASVIALLWRPQEDGRDTKKDELIIAKNRDGETTTIPVLYTGHFLRFEERELGIR